MVEAPPLVDRSPLAYRDIVRVTSLRPELLLGRRSFLVGKHGWVSLASEDVYLVNFPQLGFIKFFFRDELEVVKLT